MKPNNCVSTCLIVPTFSKNSSNIISNLISLLNAQTIEQVDLIVVNNNMFPLELHESYKKWKIVILNGKKNLWSAGGFYLGMKYAVNAGYDAYIIGDDDAVLLDDDMLDVLVDKTLSHKNISFQSCWKEKTIDGKPIHASMSCYGCVSQEIIDKVGVYSPFFFYGWEDGAFGSMLKWNNVQLQLTDKYFSHPVKPWLTYSRGSSGLSVFRHNSILQHFWTIAHSPMISDKIRSAILICIYLMTIMYGMVFFQKYFRVQSWYNLRNAILYIPPIVFQRQMTYFYPLYRDAFEDEKYETFLDNDLDIISSEKKIYTNYGNNTLAMDSWFPNLAFNNGIVQGIFSIIWYDKIYLIHWYDKAQDKIHVKWLVFFRNIYTKFFTYLCCVLLFPVIFGISLFLFILLSIKYSIIWAYMKLQENKYFSYFTK